VGQPRSTQRFTSKQTEGQEKLRDEIVELAKSHGRHGYRRIAALLQRKGWRVDHKLVERIWRQEGLKIPQKQPNRGRLWLNDGSRVRLKPTHRHHLWSCDFMVDRTYNGRPIKILTVLDEFSRERLAIVVDRQIGADDVRHCLTEFFVTHSPLEHIRSDKGSEFTSLAVRQWLENTGVRTLYIEPGSPWENRDCESFNGKFRDELLDREIFYTLWEAQVLIERWRKEYNSFRPHSSLNYRPPAPEAILSTWILHTTPGDSFSIPAGQATRTLT
jgi:putative transposase